MSTTPRLAFLFVDRVRRLVKNEEIVACRDLLPSEEIFAHHFPGRPMMPASLLIEAAAQAATILLEVGNEFRDKAFVGYVSQAKFRRVVVPGHEMVIRMMATSVRSDGAVLRGTIEQRNQRCVSLELGMAISPLSDFYPPEHRSRYRAMYETFLDGAVLEGFDRDPLERLRDA